MLYNILKDQIYDIISENIVGTASEIREIINITKKTDISERIKLFIYIAIAILSLPFIVMGPVTAIVSIVLTAVLNIINFIILIVPCYALATIGNRLERKYKNNDRLY